MKILIIGGTRFLGRYLVKSAMAAGHEITLFNRGKSNPDLFPEVEKLHGDRDGGLDILGGRSWDAVIDTCGYFPRIVTASAEFLADKAVHYTFISSISVYADMSQPGIDELSPVGKTKDETVEEIREDTYGPLKALCEQAVQKYFPDGTLVIRPGLIVGPHDLSDRFTYWVHRIGNDGRVLAPLPKDYCVQYIDVRDLSDWIILLIEKKQTGTYNGIGPETLLTMERLLDECRRTLQSGAELAWVDEEFLRQNEVQNWTELPVWINEKEFRYMLQVDCTRAFKSGLKFRPLSETIKDTYDWCLTRPDDYEWRAGLKSSRETELLEKWDEWK